MAQDDMQNPIVHHTGKQCGKTIAQIMDAGMRRLARCNNGRKCRWRTLS